VQGNDTGSPTSPYTECDAQGGVPGDCGEGIHFMGVASSVIANNTVTDNGQLGEGAGVLFANATAGTPSDDNVVVHNFIADNGLAGVTMHAHTVGPGQFEDLSGNAIVGNTIEQNNLTGDGVDGTVTDGVTTGVLVFSGTVPVRVTIAGNRIRDNGDGVWPGVGGHVTAALFGNSFHNVTNPVFVNP
jgi:hypothetical protein